MANRTRLLGVAIVSISLLNASCESGDENMLGNVDLEQSERVRHLIAAELDKGANSQLIEAFFQRHDIVYSYNRFDQRYQAIIRDVSSDPKVDQAIVIHIYVDNQKAFDRAEVSDSFTAP